MQENLSVSEGHTVEMKNAYACVKVMEQKHGHGSRQILVD
jgi:hypothetical protein